MRGALRPVRHAEQDSAIGGILYDVMIGALVALVLYLILKE